MPAECKRDRFDRSEQRDLGHLTPGREPFPHLLTVIACLDQMAGWAEVAVERLDDGQETLGMTGRLEALQRPLSSPGSLIRVLGPVVQVTALAVFGPR
jgi:hypothetical protein